MKSLRETATVREAADMLGVSVGHVHRLIDAGTITVVHRLPGLTGAKLLDRSQLEELIVTRQREVAS